VESIVLSLNRPFNDVINIGSGRSTTIVELAEIVVEQCGGRQKVVIEPSSVQSPGRSDYLLDIARSKALIGFSPHVTLEQGLRAEIEHV
jgi:nucleoside-diphosphate-sugar epimerase